MLNRCVIDIKEALLHPATVFSTPEEVRNHPELTKKDRDIT